MMKALILTAALAGLAPTADAGDVKFRIGIDSRGSIRVGVGLREGSSRRRSSHRHDNHRVEATRVWVRGHTDRIAYKVWVPERHERVLVPAKYEYRRDECGRRVRVLVRRRHYVTRCIPGRNVTRYRTVYHPGRYSVTRAVTRTVSRRASRTVRHNHGHRSDRNRGIESLGRRERNSRTVSNNRRGKRQRDRRFH